MRKLRKVCVVLLLLALSAMLVACDQGTPTTTSTADGSVASEQEDSIFNETGYPIFNEMVTMTVLFPRQVQHPTDFSDMWWTKQVREKFNINFEFELVEDVGWEEKKNLAFASGELPDVFFHKISIEDQNRYGPTGQLINLAPYIEKYGEKTKALLEEYEDVRKTYYFPDGSIYALPTFNSAERDMVVNRTYINRKWIEDLGVKEPTTLDEFYNYLVAVRDGDPNGNGDPNDEIPFTGLADGTAKNIFLEAVGLVDPYHDIINDEYVYVPVHDNYRHYLEYMNKLWNERLLDHEYFTQTLAQAQTKYSEYRVGASGSDVDVPTITAASGIDYMEYTGIKPLTSAVNNVPQVRAAFHHGPQWGIAAITNRCEYPEAVIRLIDYFYTVEGSVMVRCGPEYGTWDGEGGYIREYLEDGTEIFNPQYEGFTSYYEFRMSQSPMNVPFNSDTILTGFTINGDPLNVHISTCMFESGRLDARRFPYPDTGMTPEEQETLLAFFDIDSYVDNMEAQFIIGDLELNDDTWNNYVSTIKRMGLDDLAQIKQTVYDRWNRID